MKQQNHQLTKTVSRGVRNNNPLNIRYNSGNSWKGLAARDDKGFCVFDTMDNGLRAAAKLLKNYIEVHGCNTIELICSRWAPSNENDTEVYIRNICLLAGFKRDQRLTYCARNIVPLLYAMCRMESAIFFTNERLELAYERAYN